MQVIRRLGFGELRMHLMHARGCGTTQGALAVRVDGPLDIPAFRAAVAAVKRRHAMLGAVIVEQDGEFYFARGVDGDEGDVTVRPEQDDAEGWLDILQQENAVLLPSDRRLWRVVVVPYRGAEPRCDIIMVMHHAVMDANGADSFLDEALTLAGGGSLAPTPGGHPTRLPPSAEEACAAACSWEQFQAMQGELARKTQALKPQAHLVAAPLEQRRTMVQAFRLDADRTRRLSALCAAEDLPLNSLLSAALLVAVRSHSPDREGVALNTAVSLRRLCRDIAERDFGCYLSVVPTFHSLPDEGADLIALARDHQQALLQSFVTYARPPADHPAREVAAGFDRLKSIAVFANDIGLTYAESALRPRYGDLVVRRSDVVSRRSLGNVALVVHGLMLSGEIGFTVSHTEPLQDRAWAIAVTEKLVEILARTTGGGALPILRESSLHS